MPNRISPRSARAAQSVDRVEQMLDLRPGEVGVDHQTGLLAKQVLIAVRLQAVANRSRDAALPDDGVGDRLAGAAVPQHGRFPLIGHADRRDVGSIALGVPQDLLSGGQLRLPDRFGIVLDMAGVGENLLELLLGNGARMAVVPEKNRPAGGRPLIEGQDGGHGCSTVEGIR